VNAPSRQTETEIRAACPQDSAQMAELAGQLGYTSTEEEIARRLSAMQPLPGHAVYVAQSRDGRIVGWIGLLLFHTVEADARAEVSGLVVHEAARSQGIGRQLLERAEQWARENGCRQIGLRTNVLRERAHAFYEREGYLHSKTQRAYRKML